VSCYRNILVAHDGSADAEAALEHATQLARDQHARLTLLTVVPLPHQPGAMGAPATPDLLECFTDAQRRGANSIPADVSVTTQLLRGDPADTILCTVRNGEHDLIVMGSHGHSRLHRALLGSVSHRILHDSPVPVLLIRHNGAQPPSIDGDSSRNRSATALSNASTPQRNGSSPRADSTSASLHSSK
jgi:nucleotide-binding universal stress UspA family protein